jgi:hypothetical protein
MFWRRATFRNLGCTHPLWAPDVPDISTTQNKSLIPFPSFHSSGYIYSQNCPALTVSYIWLTKRARAAVRFVNECSRFHEYRNKPGCLSLNHLGLMIGRSFNQAVCLSVGYWELCRPFCGLCNLWAASRQSLCQGRAVLRSALFVLLPK